MLDFINKSISGIFGTKADRDLKDLKPNVDLVNAEFDKLQSLSDDELRGRTATFQAQLKEQLAGINKEIADIEEKIEQNPDMELNAKEAAYNQIDKLKKELNEKSETVLKELLPEAFAVIKETARRFKENDSLNVAATENDRTLSTKKSNVEIKGDHAIYHRKWLAAGTEVTWDMLHYDVQLIGGTVLHEGNIAEMATGEGKTLVATLPIYLNALTGRGVHVVTVNDYLAKRDCEWNAPLFEFHGLTVDCIDFHQPNSEERKKAYRSDIIYGTNNEFGFDYLRDNMARNPDDIVQREHHYAIVDEVDSVLIDEARTPLIISGPTPRGDNHEFYQLKPRIETLVKTQKDQITRLITDAKRLLTESKDEEAGLALLRAHRGLPKNKALIKFLNETGNKSLLKKTENFYMQDQSKDMHKVDAELYFVIDEKNNTIELTEKGIQLITDTGDDANFFVLPDVGSEIAEIEKKQLSPAEKLETKEELMRDFSVKSERIHTINQLLKAYTLFERDIEYIIADGKVKIVDEQTGRVLDGRRYSDGLHQAIETKESVKVESITQTYATVTLQNYFRMYHKLAGMTGTAETEAGEFWEIYKLDVVVIPTNRKIVRKDLDDLVYKTKREKYNASIEEIVKLTEAGRPVLVGTTSVEISELLSRMLKLRNIRHNVLNAKLHKKEADIVAEAGTSGTVTIATNMAGRGTDIKLGSGVKEAGGLAIIGTERHDSRRVDRQLRGRSGRQGDAGSSQFFVSLEDDLMRLFGSDRIARLMDRMGLEEGEVISHSMVSKSIERAQKKVEENNFGIRKRLLEYDDVMNSQREVIYKKRRHALYGDRLQLDLLNMKYDVADSIVSEHLQNRDYEALKFDLLRYLTIECPFDEQDFFNKNPDMLTEQIFKLANEQYKQKSSLISERAFPFIKEIMETKGATIENIIVPFTDGHKELPVYVPLKKAFDNKGKEVISAFEKSITLALIDDAWKEHLREMDELKTSVQNAVYEQKDPLLIYKFESFELFKRMIDKVNKDITSFIYKGIIAVRDTANVKSAQTQEKTDRSGYQESHPETWNEGGGDVAQAARPQAKVQPVRVEQKVGRNDPCPCGSGKKFKACHGAN